MFESLALDCRFLFQPLRKQSSPLLAPTTTMSSSTKSPRSKALASVVSSSLCTARLTGLRTFKAQPGQSWKPVPRLQS
eukprot:351965-Chlamydomonas_euryale.AAC.5